MSLRNFAHLLRAGTVFGLALALATGAAAQDPPGPNTPDALPSSPAPANPTPAAPTPANPITGFLDGLLGANKQPAPEAKPAPTPARRSAPKATASVDPRPVTQVATAGPDAAEPAAGPPHPEPPRRPVALAGTLPVIDAPAAVAATPAPSPVATNVAAVTQVAAPVAPPKTAAPVALAPIAAPETPAAALDRVNSFLNGYETFTGNFVQHNPDGGRAEGTIYVQRPGRLRFKYEPPSTLEVVADGRSVAVRDSKLKTQDVYSIGQTPLKFLLKDRIDLAADTKVLKVTTGADGLIRVFIEDTATIGGTSKITLVFDTKTDQLKQWNIVDPQGYKTTVSLYNIDVTQRR